MNRVHPSRGAARTALKEDGYLNGFSSPGRPELWVKGKSRMAVAQRIVGADEDWVIVPYPEPSGATPLEVIELAKRDGIVLNGGKVMPQPEHVVMTTVTTINDVAEVEL